MSNRTDERLSHFQSLQPNWDSYGGLPISPAAIEGATVLIAVLERLGIPDPQVYPIGNGAVGLEWSQNGADLAIEVKSIADIAIVDAEVVTAEAVQ